MTPSRGAERERDRGVDFLSMAAERVVCSDGESRDENVLAITFLPKKMELGLGNVT